MIVLSWNCRGLGNKELVRCKKSDVLFLSETLVHAVRLNEIKWVLNFVNYFGVDRLGRSDGLAMMWNDSSTIELNLFSQNFIDLKVKDTTKGDWRITGFYGFPERRRRRESWNLLRSLAGLNNLPWLCVGDFNDMLMSCEKDGGAIHPNSLYDGFCTAIEECGLRGLPSSGGRFTWERWEGGTLNLREKLDRVIANGDWFGHFPNCHMTVAISVCSDHVPLVVTTKVNFNRWRRKRFQLENSWLLEPGLPAVVQHSWHRNKGHKFMAKMDDCRADLISWGSHLRRDYVAEIKEIESQLVSCHDRIGLRSDANTEYARLHDRLNVVIEQEELKWKQR